MPSWIRSRNELERLAEALRGCSAIALDSESDSLHHHFEKVCLVQLGTPGGEAFLIDPLAFSDLTPLAPLLADPGTLKILHGADYDVTTLKRDFGFVFEGLFDTMIAARFLGRAEVGLLAVAAAELGVTLCKDSQRDDWSRRPLTQRQEAYAAADVLHLIALHARLSAALCERGRLEWVLEECAAVAALAPARRLKDPEGWRKLKGVARLPRRALAVLREVHRWREGEAEASNVPAFKILGTEALLSLATKPPGDVAALRALRGLSFRVREQACAVLAAVRRGLELPESDLPVMAPPPRPVVPEPVRRRIDALRAWRAAEGARLGLDVSLVLPQRLLEKVAEAAPRTPEALEAVPGLRRWRARTFGAALLSVVARA